MPRQVIPECGGVLEVEIQSVFLSIHFVTGECCELVSVCATRHIGSRKVERNILAGRSKLFDLFDRSRLGLVGGCT